MSHTLHTDLPFYDDLARIRHEMARRERIAKAIRVAGYVTLALSFAAGVIAGNQESRAV